MLARLRLRDYALVDEVEIDFTRGLTALTGETGAGKSILVEALELLLGARASTDTIRDGAEKATIEGLFVDAGGEVVVKREILRDRTNRCYLDGEMTTARALTDHGARRVHVHGQHEDQLLLKRGVQRDLLDAYAGAGGLAGEVADLATRLAALDREVAELASAGAERTNRIEFLAGQLEEIERAEIREGEDESLEIRADRLRHAEQRGRLAGGLHDALDVDERSVTSVLAGLERDLERLAALDQDVGGWVERLAAARYEIGDLALELGRYAESVELDPAALATVEARLGLLRVLERKHGARSVDELLEHAREMRSELDALRNEGRRGEAIREERRRVRQRLETSANALADAREAAADRLEGVVGERLAALGMGEGTFRVELERRPDPDGVERSGERVRWTRGGLEGVSFLIAPNPGEIPRPLSRIASGGELSRTLLALEAALAEADRTPTLVFDEIDAGIGGTVAHRVAGQLREVARHHQVIVVTHLAQIAAAADHHLVVEKTARGGRTSTGVRRVLAEARVREVSRLLGGDPERDVSLSHAEQLLAGRG